jgi:aryl-phospho-beta-D-glucosidase BglC (GH1 family)
LKNSFAFSLFWYTADGGYIDNPSVKNKVKEAVEAAKELGIYVIIDWHILNAVCRIHRRAENGDAPIVSQPF